MSHARTNICNLYHQIARTIQKLLYCIEIEYVVELFYACKNFFYRSQEGKLGSLLLLLSVSMYFFLFFFYIIKIAFEYTFFICLQYKKSVLDQQIDSFEFVTCKFQQIKAHRAHIDKNIQSNNKHKQYSFHLFFALHTKHVHD